MDNDTQLLTLRIPDLRERFDRARDGRLQATGRGTADLLGPVDPPPPQAAPAASADEPDTEGS